MLKLVGAAVVLLLVGPLVLIGIAGALFVAVALVRDGAQRLRATVWCPLTGRRVTADFLVPLGDTHPSEVMSCTAFSPPAQITCKKPCRDVIESRWGARLGLFPGWALTADGPVTCPGNGRQVSAVVTSPVEEERERAWHRLLTDGPWAAGRAGSPRHRAVGRET